jgi:hypothetical protein
MAYPQGAGQFHHVSCRIGPLDPVEAATGGVGKKLGKGWTAHLFSITFVTLVADTNNA